MVYLPKRKPNRCQGTQKDTDLVTEDGKESGKGGRSIDASFACPSRYGIPFKTAFSRGIRHTQVGFGDTEKALSLSVCGGSFFNR